MYRLGGYRQRITTAWAGGLGFAALGLPRLISEAWRMHQGLPPHGQPWLLAWLGIVPIALVCGARVRNPWTGAGVAATAAAIGCWLLWTPLILIRVLPRSVFTEGLSQGEALSIELASLTEDLVLFNLLVFWLAVGLAALAGAIGGAWARDPSRSGAQPLSLAWGPTWMVRLVAMLWVMMAAYSIVGDNLAASGVSPDLHALLWYHFWLTLWLATTLPTTAALRWARCGRPIMGLVQLCLVLGIAQLFSMVCLFTFGILPVGLAWLPAGLLVGGLLAWIRRPTSTPDPTPGWLWGEALWAGTTSVPFLIGTGLVSMALVLGNELDLLTHAHPIDELSLLTSVLASGLRWSVALVAVDALLIAAVAGSLLRFSVGAPPRAGASAPIGPSAAL